MTARTCCHQCRGAHVTTMLAVEVAVAAPEAHKSSVGHMLHRLGMEPKRDRELIHIHFVRTFFGFAFWLNEVA